MLKLCLRDALGQPSEGGDGVECAAGALWRETQTSSAWDTHQVGEIECGVWWEMQLWRGQMGRLDGACGPSKEYGL